jgi:pimeloyl-ACP methyl ester carboxylesterase
VRVSFAHATSFCGSLWDPITSLLPDIECVTWDFVGHGGGPPLSLPVDWAIFGEQVLEETTPGGIGVGHSMGATALLMAQLADPRRFGFLVLIEPIVFPGPHQRLVEHPLSYAAQRRTATFESREAFRANLRSKPAFAGWSDAAMDAYLECGLIGEGPVHLACDPEVEADIYRGSNAHDTFERMGEIDVPVLLLAGERSDTTPPEVVRHQGAQFKRAGIEIVAGTGHFLPMERPELVAERLGRLVGILN